MVSAGVWLGLQAAQLPGQALPRGGMSLNPGPDCGGKTQPESSSLAVRPAGGDQVAAILYTVLSPSFGSPSHRGVGPDSSDLKKLSSPEWGSQWSVWSGAAGLLMTPQPVSQMSLPETSHSLGKTAEPTPAQAAPVPADGLLCPGAPRSARYGCSRVQSPLGHVHIPACLHRLLLVGPHTIQSIQSKPDPPPVP